MAKNQIRLTEDINLNTCKIPPGSTNSGGAHNTCPPRRKHNSNYLQYDKNILEIIFREPRKITVAGICNELSIFPKTFHNHYKTIELAIEETKKLLVLELKSHLQKIPSAETVADNKQVYQSIFLFLTRQSKEKPIYHILTNNDNAEIVVALMEVFYPKLCIDWTPVGITPPNTADTPVRFFFHDLIFVLREWAEKTGCDIRQSKAYITALIELTKDARRHYLVSF